MSGGRNEKLREALCFFTREKKIMDGMAVAAGKGDALIRARDGRDAGERTLFDLASVTKLFTALCLMRLWEAGSLDPFRRVTDYDPRFENLHTVTVEQLMAFQVMLKTPGRLDEGRDREEALRRLFAAAPQKVNSLKDAAHFTPGKTLQRFYSDIPAMVLKYVIEAAAGKPFYDTVREIVLRPAGMEDTFAKVPEDRVNDCPLYGPEYRIEKDNFICRDDPARGIPHDPKAALLQGNTGDLCGHAGLFATEGDMIRFCVAVLSGKIVKPETIATMTVNRTGRMFPDGTYSQFLGYQCYLKHPQQYFSEIPESMSKKAFGIGGFTGNHVSIDPETKRFTVMLGNRVRERVTVLLPPAGKGFADYGLMPDGSGTVLWPDGREIPSSVNYVHQKDEKLHKVIDSLLKT